MKGNKYWCRVNLEESIYSNSCFCSKEEIIFYFDYYWYISNDF